MEEEDGVASNRGSVIRNDTRALNYSLKAGVDAGSVDLVGRLKTLSFGRKKLMTKYFDLEEVENGPILSEYFAVSLAFVALGSLIREANVRMRRKDKDNSDGVSPKLQRMALDSMLKSAMERLRELAHKTQTLEEKVRDRSYMEVAFNFERFEFMKRISDLEAIIAKYVEAEAVWRREKDDLVKRIADVDAQRGYFFKKMAEAEASSGDMQRLRMEDGKANAKLVEIYAGREQSWKLERIKMRHEIELLKEKLSKLQPQSQVKPPCSFDVAAEALRMRNLKRRANEIVRESIVSEREFAAVVAVEHTPKAEVDLSFSEESIVPALDRKDSEGADTLELSAVQNLEMEAELAIILKRVGALKRRGASGGKLDELLNEAKGKHKLKRLGSFDQPPEGTLVDDTFLCLSEAYISKDVEIDKKDDKDIWQAIEVQEGIEQRRNGVVGEVAFKREPVRIGFVGSAELFRKKSNSVVSCTNQCLSERLAVVDHDKAPVRMSVLDFTQFFQEKPKPTTPERSSIPRTPEWLTVADNHIDLESIAVNSNVAVEPTVLTEDEPMNPDTGGWEEFTRDKLNTPENDISECDNWEEFIQQKLNTLEDNISERTPEESTFPDHDNVPDSVAVNSKLTSDQRVEPLNLDEGGWVEAIEHNNGWEHDFKGYSVTCAEHVSPDKTPVVISANDPVGHSLDDRILFEDDAKSETLLGSEQLEEAHRLLSLGSQLQTQSSALDIDPMSKESDNPSEIPGVRPEHDPVEHTIVNSLELPEDDIKSEIIESSSISTSPNPDSNLIDMDDYTDERTRAVISERQVDLLSDNGESYVVPSNGQNLQIAQDGLNNSTPQLSTGRTIIAGLEIKHQK